MPRKPSVKLSPRRHELLMDILLPNAENRRLRFHASQSLSPGYADRCKKAIGDDSPSNKQIAHYLGVTAPELDFHLNPKNDDYIQKRCTENMDRAKNRLSDTGKAVDGRSRDLSLANQSKLCVLVTGDIASITWLNMGVCFDGAGNRIAPGWAIGDDAIAEMEQASFLSAASDVLGLHKGVLPYSTLVQVVRCPWIDAGSILSALANGIPSEGLHRKDSNIELISETAKTLSLSADSALSILDEMGKSAIELVILWLRYPKAAREGAEYMACRLGIDLQQHRQPPAGTMPVSDASRLPIRAQRPQPRAKAKRPTKQE